MSKKVSNKILLFINLILIIATLFSYASSHVNPRFTWFLSLFGLLLPFLVLANFGVMIFWLIKDYKFAFFSFVTLLLGYAEIPTFFVMNPVSNEVPENKIEIVTYNTKGFSELKKSKTRDKLIRELQSFFEMQKKVDIWCFQEINPYSKKLIETQLPEINIISEQDKGTIIGTNHPVINKGIIDFGTKTNSCLWADLLINQDTLRVYSIHLQSNKVSGETAQVMKEYSNEKTWGSVREIITRYKNTTQIRSEQAQKVNDHIQLSPYPVLIAGDFNDPPQSFIYRKLKKGLKDGFVEAGNGLGYTYAEGIPLLRIDYIFATLDLTFLEYKAIKKKFSDHYPVKASIFYKRENP